MTNIGRRSFIQGTAAAAALGGLAACSQGGSSGSGSVRMVMFPGPQGDALQAVVDSYNAGQGKTDGVNVETVLLSRTDTFSKEATMMAAGSADVDLYFTASYIIGQHASYFDPLDDIQPGEYFTGSTDGFTVDGSLMALPLNVSNIFLFYRKDLIEQLLTDQAAQATYAQVSAALGSEREPRDPADWDWADYVAASAYFTGSVNSSSPTEYGTALQAKNLMFNVMVWNNLLWSEGGSWTVDDAAAFDSAEARNALEVYQQIYTSGYTSPDSANAEFPETQAAFQAGSIAFALQWSTAFGALNNPDTSPETAGKIAITRSPGSDHSTHIHTQGFGLNSNSRNKEAAKTWLEYLATPEAMTEFAGAGGIAAMPEVLRSAEEDPTFPEIADQVEEYGFNEPILRTGSQAFTALADEISPAWVGRRSPDEAAQAANAALDELLDA